MATDVQSKSDYDSALSLILMEILQLYEVFHGIPLGACRFFVNS